MIKYYGITELIGETNTGKTSIAIEESKIYNTLYVSSTNFSIKRYNFDIQSYNNVLIEISQSSIDLQSVLKNKIKYLVDNKLIELLIIDNLYHIMYLDSSYKIINILKRLSKYVKILIVNTCGEAFIGHKIPFIHKLGLNWEYQVNTRYRCFRHNGSFYIELIKCPIDLCFKRKLTISKDKVVFECNV